MKIAQENLSPLVQTGLVNSMCSSVTFVRQYFWHVMYLFLVYKNKTEWGGQSSLTIRKAPFARFLFWKHKGIYFFSLQMLHKTFVRRKKHLEQKRAFEFRIYFFTVLNFKGYHYSWYILWWCVLWTLEDCKHIHTHNFKSVYDRKFFTLSSSPHPFAYGLIKGKTLVKVNVKCDLHLYVGQNIGI